MLFINITEKRTKEKKQLVHFLSRLYMLGRYLLARHIHYTLILDSPSRKELKEIELGEGRNLTFTEGIPGRVSQVLATARIFFHDGNSSFVSPVRH